MRHVRLPVKYPRWAPLDSLCLPRRWWEADAVTFLKAICKVSEAHGSGTVERFIEYDGAVTSRSLMTHFEEFRRCCTQ